VESERRKVLEMIPKHVAIIMDGDRRWAAERGLEPFEGHQAGFENLKMLVPYVFTKGVEILTVFAFSTENWKRDAAEVEFLFSLFQQAIEEQGAEFAEKNIRIRFIGDRRGLPQALQLSMGKVEQESASNTGGIFVPAINYGGRDELVRACRKIIEKGVHLSCISESAISWNLDTARLADPDLIIRTAGEERLSGFLLWQASYAEFYTSRKYWPDFSKRDFRRALEVYASRERRYGGDKAV
jgi:undecaprenyl diphosphate synthase